MKYLEELSIGDCFEFKNHQYLLTQDFKKNGDKLCYCLTTGVGFWLPSNMTVEIFSIYGLDTNNNIYPLRSTSSTNVNTKN